MRYKIIADSLPKSGKIPYINALIVNLPAAEAGEKQKIMAFVIANHKVKDYSAWRPKYDADEERRTSAGIKTVKVFTDENDPNDVTMYWEVENTEKVREMMKDPELKTRMEEAGVVSDPNVWYLKDAN